MTTDNVPCEALTSTKKTAIMETSCSSLISSIGSSRAPGLRLFGHCFNFENSRNKRVFHQSLVLILTYLAYAAYHMGRRPLSVVKNVLNRHTPELHHNNQTIHLNNDTFNEIYSSTSPTTDNSFDWAPFDNDKTANKLLAILDSSFLLSYAVFMFFSGVIADRMNLRYFLTIGMITSGLGLIAFGAAKPLDIHTIIFFVVVQIISGFAQTTGWPATVTCVSNWFDTQSIGLIYGIWNSHTSVGNIAGAVIAGFFVERDWSLSFIVPGLIMISVAILIFLFLAPNPEDVDLGMRSEQASFAKSNYLERSEDIRGRGPDSHKAVPFVKALAIPGVIEYSLCLFFSKLVSYTFLYWLPRYITLSTTNDSEDSAYLSTPFDIGGLSGSVLAGYISDQWSGKNGIVCSTMLLMAIPSMYLYQQFGNLSNCYNVGLQLIVGALVNGPYCLITTSVSNDLGNRIQDARSMATVSAIIDGTGSLGAVIGPLFAGFVSDSNWQVVFYMLMISNLIAFLCITRVTFREIKFLKVQKEHDGKS